MKNQWCERITRAFQPTKRTIQNKMRKFNRRSGDQSQIKGDRLADFQKKKGERDNWYNYNPTKIEPFKIKQQIGRSTKQMRCTKISGDLPQKQRDGRSTNRSIKIGRSIRHKRSDRWQSTLRIYIYMYYITQQKYVYIETNKTVYTWNLSNWTVYSTQIVFSNPRSGATSTHKRRPLQYTYTGIQP